ncbi:RelA/SpoT family protein [Patescibacteria group bacterium]|nr:RelA/SpoT family protein [Patescibacteria group bacterium]
MTQKKQTDVVFEELKELIKKELPDVNLDRVRRAYFLTKEAHEGQYRMSGEPYISHPIETVKILVCLKVDEDTIIAGMLHDVPEDTKIKISDVEKAFGKHVAKLVDAVTKLSKVHYKYSMDERQVQSLQKMVLETAEDVRVILVKLADRLHNIQTLQYLRPEKQQRIAKETMEIFAPLANLFGIYQLRRQLEDGCFMYLQPEEYARIEAFVHDHDKKRSHFVNSTIEALQEVFDREGLKVELEGRPKHFYSIYQKMVRDQKVLQDIYDYFAIRVITEKEEDCYKVLGLVHQVYKPKPGRIKDYIALPKPNGYQSLHTTVIGLRGKLTEIQIRTNKMHEQAELGAAAHLFYKNGNTTFTEQSLSILKTFTEPGMFFKTLQEDILQDRISVFSPSGEIVNLPEGSVVLDYMFTLGLPTDKKFFRAMVNNKIYSITGQLNGGDTVEIIYGNKDREGPERWWLEHVKTATAQEKIRDFYKQKSLSTKVNLGQQLFQKELDHEDRGMIYNLPNEKLDLVTEKFEAKNFEQLLAMIGEGSLSAETVYRVMFPKLNIGTINFIFSFFSRIFAWLSRGEQINKYKIRIVVEANDRTGLLKDLIQPFYDLKVPLIKSVGQGYDVFQSKYSTSHALGMPGNRKYLSRDYFDFLIERHEQLIALFDRLEKVPGVIKVRRVFRRNQVSFVLLASAIGAFWVMHPFLVQYLTAADVKHVDLWLDVLIYFGLLSLLLMMVWLKSMGDKTFPHFEETKIFWPLAYGLTFLAIITMFLEDVVFDLGLQLTWMVAFSAVILTVVTYAYLSHEKRRTRHLNRLKAGAHKKLKVPQGEKLSESHSEDFE